MRPPAARFRRPPNPVTQAAFRRQVRREIYLPLTLVVLLIVGLVVLAVGAGYRSAGAWADVVLVALAIPMALALLVLLVVMVGAAFLMARVIGELPSVTVGLQHGVERVSGAVRRASDAAVRPVIVPKGLAAALRRARGSMRSVLRGE